MSRLCLVSLSVAPNLENLLLIMYILVTNLFRSIGRLGRGRSSVVQQEVARWVGVPTCGPSTTAPEKLMEDKLDSSVLVIPAGRGRTDWVARARTVPHPARAIVLTSRNS